MKCLPIDIILRKYESVVVVLKLFMGNVLRFSNFRLILINKKRKTGYYSFKRKGNEICLDHGDTYGWLVCLCNKWEEVVDETMVSTKEQAVDQANKYYQCFGKLDILYK